MKLIFAGTPAVAAHLLEQLALHHEIRLVVTRTDARVGRKQEVRESEVSEVARRLKLPVLKTNRIRTEDLVRIENAGADLGVVVAFGGLIPDTALKLFRWWNVHFSVLPHWRGASPAQHAIWFGIGGGLSIFELTQKLDEGPLVFTEAIPSLVGETADEYVVRLGQLAGPRLLECLDSQPSTVPQIGAATWAPKLTKDMAKIDFSETAVKVEAKTLAMTSEPGAWCNAGELRLKLLKVKAVGSIDWDALEETPLRPGAIRHSNGRVLVQCGGGTLLQLELVQPAGKRPMSAADWLRGFRELKTLE